MLLFRKKLVDATEYEIQTCHWSKKCRSDHQVSIDIIANCVGPCLSIFSLLIRLFMSFWTIYSNECWYYILFHENWVTKYTYDYRKVISEVSYRLRGKSWFRNFFVPVVPLKDFQKCFSLRSVVLMFNLIKFMVLIMNIVVVIKFQWIMNSIIPYTGSNSHKK